MKIIVLNAAFGEAQRERILQAAKEAGGEVCFIEDEGSIPEDFRDAEVAYGFCVNTARSSKALKWLCIPYAGVDVFLRDGAFANEECILSNSSGAYGVTIAEHIIGVSIMMMRQFTKVYAESMEAIWGERRVQHSLKDCRITALGTGDIGTTFAKRARAFEPKQLIGVSRSGVSPDPVFNRVEKIEKLDEVLKETDLLVMSLPETPETRDILSEKRMELLPDGAYIVNVGRGSAIDEAALIKNLENGHLAGAALDVFKTEPLPADSPLWKTENLLITPHVAGNLTLEHTLNKNVDMFCEDLINYSKGRPLKYYVNRTRGY